MAHLRVTSLSFFFLLSGAQNLIFLASVALRILRTFLFFFLKKHFLSRLVRYPCEASFSLFLIFSCFPIFSSFLRKCRFQRLY